MSKHTTIQISEETKVQLAKLKVHPRESYDEVIERLLKDKAGLQDTKNG